MLLLPLPGLLSANLLTWSNILCWSLPSSGFSLRAKLDTPRERLRVQLYVFLAKLKQGLETFAGDHRKVSHLQHQMIYFKCFSCPTQVLKPELSLVGRKLPASPLSRRSPSFTKTKASIFPIISIYMRLGPPLPCLLGEKAAEPTPSGRVVLLCCVLTPQGPRC